MNKRFSFLSLLLGLFICVTVFSACGSDNEPSSGGNSGSGSSETPQSSKHVVKITTEEGNAFYESSFSYDSQGRVTKIIETESGAGTNSHSEKTYQYGEMLIVTKSVMEVTYSNGQSSSLSESHSYTLENGRIVKDEEIQAYNGNSSSSITETFSYDANNNLSSISRKGSNYDSETKNITWSDGNLIKLGNRAFTYSNHPWTKSFPLSLDGSNMDAYLFSIGYYGNIPKNLPSKTYTSETSGATYDYTLEGNYVTKVVVTPLVETNKSQKSISTIVWE
jgi:hypothetical protein